MATVRTALAAGPLALALATTGPGAVAADEVTLYAGPERSGGYTLFGPRLADAMEGRRSVEIVPTGGTRETLERVIADPAAVGFAQFDNFRRFMEDPQNADAPLEFYGDVPFCVLAATRANGPWSLPPDEIPSELAPKAVDIGPPGSDSAESLAPLVASAPKLEEVGVEHRGGARGLSRLRQRATDIVFLIEYPHRRSPVVGDIIEAEDIAFLPSPAILFSGGKSDVSGAFIPTRIVVPSNGWFAPSLEINTVCTPFGVVVNGAGDPDTLDFVVRAATEGALIGEQEGFWRSLGNILSRTWSGLVNGIWSWFG